VLSAVVSLACVGLPGCGERTAYRHVPARGRAIEAAPETARARGAVGGTPSRLWLSVVGTNDLHGRIASLPALGGYLANLREARARDGGAVVLLDAGDMFQGTIESNFVEGASVVAAYNALGYAAAAVGNHEFDFGPEGPAPTPRHPEDDPRGALRARAREARFPLLIANLVDEATGRRVEGWENMPPYHVVDAAGVRVGIIGVTTEQTPTTTIAANFRGLRVAPLSDTIAETAARLRASGVHVVLVTAHAGGRCRSHDDPHDVGSCEPDQEIFAVAAALPRGSVDAIVAGHTHAVVAHDVHGIAVIESLANGQAFGRVDLELERDATGGFRVVDRRIFPPERLCGVATHLPCADVRYEGAPVVPDARVAEVVGPYLEAARRQGEERLGPQVTAPFERRGDRETALGNLLADLMREIAPGGADVALLNGGGIRAPIDAGPLTYGDLFETFPFDNRFAVLRIDGATLRRVVTVNLTADESILSLSGVRVTVRCRGRVPEVRLFRADGRPLRDGDRLRVATSDFVATGGDAILSAVDRAFVEMPDDVPNIREALVERLRRFGGVLAPDRYLDPARPRWSLPSPRPVRCTGGGDASIAR
jgi:5'-nucleotidase